MRPVGQPGQGGLLAEVCAGKLPGDGAPWVRTGVHGSSSAGHADSVHQVQPGPQSSWGLGLGSRWAWAVA